MFTSHGVWRLRTRNIRARAKQADMDYDDFPEAKEWQEKAIKIDLSGLRRSARENNPDPV